VGLGAFGYSIQQQLTRGLGTTAGGSGAWYPPAIRRPVLGASHGGGAAATAHCPATKIGGLSVPSNWASPRRSGHRRTCLKATTVNYLAAEAPASNGILQGMP